MCPADAVELGVDALLVGLHQRLHQRQRVVLQYGVRVPQVLRSDRQALPVVGPGLLDQAVVA